MDKVYVNVDRFGNTSAASVAIALDEAVRGGRVQPGMKLMFCAFGAGFTWASMVVQGEQRRGGSARGRARQKSGWGKTWPSGSRRPATPCRRSARRAGSA